MTKFIRTTIVAGLWAIFGAFVVITGLGLWYLQSRPDLSLWHSSYLKGEIRADTVPATFDQYLGAEKRLFLTLKVEIVDKIPTAAQSPINRFTAGSKSDPNVWKRNWNASFELPGSGSAVLLLHGMSDSPYSLRAIAEKLNERGHHVLGLRLPGHGTAPSGLVHVHWEDMAAAVKLAMHHLSKEVGKKKVFFVGYSNGAALAVHYTLTALVDMKMHKPAGLVLISPQIQITPAAAFAKWQSRFGRLIGLDKVAWNSLRPEYDPYKYNSFAVNAGQQSFEITQEIATQIAELEKKDALSGMPNILAFQSAADATIIARGIIDGLLQKLPTKNNHLVVFDINRESESISTIVNDPMQKMDDVVSSSSLPFDFTVIANRAEGDADVVARHKKSGEEKFSVTDLGLQWPDDQFSLSHVALPFAPDDPLYGDRPVQDKRHIYLGRLDLRGERGVLEITPSDMLRQRWNPFFDVLMADILAFLQVEGKK